jgi:hypothetical protein
MVGLLRDDSLFVVALLFIGSYLVLLFNFARKLHARTILSVNCTTKRYKSGCFSWTTLVAIFNSTYKMSQTGTIPCGPSRLIALNWQEQITGGALNWRDNSRSRRLDQLPLLRDFEVSFIEMTTTAGTIFERRESSDADKERRGFVDDGFGIFVFSLPSRNINWLLGIFCR